MKSLFSFIKSLFAKPEFKLDWSHELLIVRAVKVKVVEEGLDFYGNDGYLAFTLYRKNADKVAPNWRKFIGMTFERTS
jgi:hypothetical protein